ncbi:hypothetical protein L596_009918 [Steinernema carpocapsae]|nr:hypothetical protein L596_009918 [Steinernema carpocapsae]
MLRDSLILLLVAVSVSLANHCWNEKSINGNDVLPRESKFCIMDWCVTVAGTIDGETGTVRYCGGIFCSLIGETCVDKSVSIPVIGSVDGNICCCRGDHCNNAAFATEAPAPPPTTTTTTTTTNSSSTVSTKMGWGVVTIAGLSVLLY